MIPEIRPPPYESSEPKSQQRSTAAHHQISQPMRADYNSCYDRDAPDTLSSLANEKSTLDFTQRIERKLAEYNASHNVFKRWLFEILSWLVSAFCMGAMIGIYIWLKDKRMSQVGELLTYTNILGKVASAALIVPTSEALGQLKWNWFHDSRAMWDFKIFDKASRYEYTYLYDL